MKPTDIFSAILKSIGVMFWAYSLAGLPGAIRYSPYFYKVDTTIRGLADGVDSYWQLSLVHSVILFVFGCFLVFGTELFVRLAYRSPRGASADDSISN